MGSRAVTLNTLATFIGWTVIALAAIGGGARILASALLWMMRGTYHAKQVVNYCALAMRIRLSRGRLELVVREKPTPEGEA